MVAPSAGRVDETASDAANEELVVNLELDGVLELLLLGDEHLIQLLGLRDSTRESIKDETLDARLVVLQLLLDHTYHDVIRDESSLVHDLLGFHSEIRLLCNLLTEHVTSGKMADPVIVLLQDLGRLCAFASAGWANQDHADAILAARGS